ncbi:hypothetical protein [Clostridium beijerinckii]|uniref:hypothetical protein n=1 Tax=Clostridium beijerinckii TaxID=1520 RepID=UPI00047AB9A6|nr:hypothetical protein [Clostridium beijerinckii]
MEFRLNKIDTDIRKKMQEETKDDKIHSSDGISVKKDLKEEKNEVNIEELCDNSKEKLYFTIDGVKYNNASVKIKAEKLEEISEENSKGRVLDATK